MYTSLKKFTQADEIELYGRISVPILETSKMLAPGNSIRIRLQPASNQFCLLGSASTAASPFLDHIELLESHLQCTRVLVNSKVSSILSNQLSKVGRHEFYYQDRNVQSLVLAQGIQNFVTENILLETPTMCVLALVESAAYNGASDKSALFFKHHNLKSVEMTLNGETITPPLEFDMSSKTYMKLYRRLYDVITQCSGSCNLLPEDLNLGLFMVPIMIDDSVGVRNDRILLHRPGNIRLNLSFTQPLGSNLTALIYYQNDKLLTIEKNGSVYVT